MNHSSKGNESDAGPTASLLARLRSATTPAPTSVPEAPRPPAPKPVAAAQAVAELTPSAKAPVAASSGYTVVAPATGDAQAWHQQSVAEAQERAFRPLLDQMKAGQVREDFRSVADAIEATGLEAPTVLEVGCGSGYYHEVLGHLLGSKVKHVGVDYSEAMIALAKSRYPQGQFHVGDATRLPFADRSYDIVMDGVALMHIQDYERAIQEARRVARHFVIFNTAVLLASRSTTRLNKRAYGQETSEFILNEGELRMLLAKYGMYVAASFESIPYDLHDTLGEHTYTKTIVCGLIGEAHDAGSVLVNLGCGSHFHPIWMNIDIASPHPAVHEHNLMAGVPLPDESCDAVYHSHVLEHMPKHQAEPFIAECFRVLKPGGVIRIAIPDLEQICRHYLSNLDSAVEGDQEAAHRYDWMMMELIDQMTRNESGGEMGRYWRQNPMPAEDFVIERVGQEVKGYLAQVRAQGGGQPPRRQWSAAEIGTFRQSGEIHQWMYDRFSLKRLLTKAGFVGARVCQANESRIHRFGDYQLDTDDSGQTRKPDSLFMEAVRV